MAYIDPQQLDVLTDYDSPTLSELLGPPNQNKFENVHKGRQDRLFGRRKIIKDYLLDHIGEWFTRRGLLEKLNIKIPRSQISYSFKAIDRAMIRDGYNIITRRKGRHIYYKYEEAE